MKKSIKKLKKNLEIWKNRRIFVAVIKSNNIMEYTRTIDNYTISFTQIGGNYNYGIFDVQVEKEGKIIYSDSKYHYDYLSWGATYTEVLSDIYDKITRIFGL